MTEFVASLGRYPHTAALFESPVGLPGGGSLTVEAGGTGQTARRMMQELAFDVCEMPLVNFLCARERGLEVTGLPVFTTRRFPQGMLIWNTGAGVHRVSDLVGKRVGTPYNGNTDAVWVRGMMKDSYGIDHESITWVTSAEEPFPDVVLSPNVEQRPGSSLGDLLLAGELAGLVEGRGQTIFAPHVECLAADLAAAERAWYAETGIFPVLFTVVVRNSTLAARPDFAAEVYSALNAAKSSALTDIEAGTPLDDEALPAAVLSGFPLVPTAQSDRAYLGPDPLAYGLEANRLPIETLIRFALDQHVLRAEVRADDAFLALD